MTLSEELQWRGFVNQTTYKDLTDLDNGQITFYWGVDPSADSMQVGNFAMAMMVRHFIDHGHRAILLVGGATGLIGDPDGKKQERELKSVAQVAQNKAAISAQYRQIFAGKDFEIVDNYDWFKGIGYLEFLRDVGKHVPMRQMLSREFVQSRLSDEGDGISYAEFSYSLIQGYDFLHLFREKGATLQVAGADQWGNSIAGVELIRRIAGGEAHVWTGPLIINKTTGVKFGKSEGGAIWLDKNKTSVYDFYQFWLNVDDDGAEDYAKIYTLLSRDELADAVRIFNEDRSSRHLQKLLAYEVTKLVHGEAAADAARSISPLVVSSSELADDDFARIKAVFELKPVRGEATLAEVLVKLGLATSNTEARRFVQSGAIAINNQRIAKDKVALTAADFHNGIAVVRRGKNQVAVASQA